MLKTLKWMPLWMCGGAVATAIVLYLLLDPSPPITTAGLHSDKALHLFAFGGLTGWFLGLLEHRAWPWLAAGMLLFALGTEFTQGAMALGRVAEWGDLLADVAGIALAFGLGALGLEHWAAKFERWIG